MTDEELIEALADKEHASWARWMAYLFSVCDDEVIGDPDGVSIRGELARAWKQQIETPYAALSEREKQLDRDEVAHILPIIQQAIRQAREAAYDDIQEFVVLHTFDTSAGRRIDDYITERLKVLKAGDA